jgi:hypothetical protein
VKKGLRFLFQSGHKKAVHPVLGRKGLEVSVMNKPVASFWEGSLHPVKLEARMSLQESLDHIFVLLMKDRAGTIN